MLLNFERAKRIAKRRRVHLKRALMLPFFGFALVVEREGGLRTMTLLWPTLTCGYQLILAKPINR